LFLLAEKLPLEADPDTFRDISLDLFVFNYGLIRLGIVDLTLAMPSLLKLLFYDPILTIPNPATVVLVLLISFLAVFPVLALKVGLKLLAYLIATRCLSIFMPSFCLQLVMKLSTPDLRGGTLALGTWLLALFFLDTN
jgi:hypothetical protein